MIGASTPTTTRMNPTSITTRILFLGLLLFSGPAFADSSREIAWQDLIPQAPVEFDDPFAKLSGEQLMQLAQVARIRRLLENEKIPADGPSAEDEKRSVAELSSEGINVDWLLSQRERVTRERMLRAEQVDEGLSGKRIRIPGYTLPLALDKDRRITEFLLVPWVGACIHTPPPPPNQMIHVSVPGGTELRGRYSPVWIEGAIELKPGSYDLFLVDGSMQVKVAYTMVTESISDYLAAESDTLAKVEIPETSFEGHSWLQKWQAKASLIFTRAMSGLRDDGSSKAFWFAILVAFGYGLVHTLGPGHGKSVVISYFIGEGGSFHKGITMGVMIAITHVLSSIIVVLVMDFAVRQATGQAPSDYRAIRLGSYALIIVIGAVMLRSAIQALRESRKTEHSHVGHAHHHESHGDNHDDHDHHDCLACAALEKRKKGAGTWLALAVGSVPCTGALLVLLFGVANDLLFPAILMVAAISTGMAIAMSGIGVLAILGRSLAFRRMKDDEARRARFTSRLRIAGAALVLMIGTLLFVLTYSDIGQLTLPSQTSGVSNPEPVSTK